MEGRWQPSLGALPLGGGRCRFRVWAPQAEMMEVHLVSPQDRLVPLHPQSNGYYEAMIEDVAVSSLYFYRLDSQFERPDPASRCQPEGVHGPSQVISSDFAWLDQAWFGLPLDEYIFYELHVGTFTPEGTFDAVIPHLAELKELGVTAVELMPVAQFPGARNWGYDGAYPFAVQDCYGGPEGLKRLVNACHGHGLAAVLDVVYNHLGPEGNYLGALGPYFTDQYKTPWGSAINFDGAHSDDVRHYFIENALYWQTEFRIDALRLDAVHAIHDFSAEPFLEELALATQEQAERLNRRFYLIAESNLNDARLIRPRELGGYGLDAQWSDDLHHCLHTLLTGERNGYYEDFGSVRQLAKAYRDSFVYDGVYSPFRRRRHGNPARELPGRQFVVCAQNHDQVGNRMLGERLSQLVSFESLKLAAGAVLLAPNLPLLFMGEEYGETAPFQYFTSHGDEKLIQAVRRGRREEFVSFAWQGHPPDPQDEQTFLRCKLHRELGEQERGRVLREFYRELIRLRRTVPALAQLSKDHLEAAPFEREQVIFLRRWCGADEVFLVLHFGEAPITLPLPVRAGRWRKRLDAGEPRWLGSGTRTPSEVSSAEGVTLALEPKAFVVFQRMEQE